MEHLTQPVGPAAAKLLKEASVLVCHMPSVATTESNAAPMSVLQWQHELHVLVDSVVASSPSLWKFSATPLGFVVASGVTSDDEQGAEKLVDVAKQIMELTKEWKLPQGGPAFLRLCVHSGEMAAGVIGSKSLQYQVYGPVVDVAAAASATASAGAVKVTEATLRQLGGQADAWRRSTTLRVGGETIQTFELEVFPAPQMQPEAAGAAAPAAGPIQPTTAAVAYCKHCRAAAGPDGGSSSGVPVTTSETAQDDRVLSHWDLQYASPTTEALFRAYFNKGQAPLDITFTCVGLASQLAWIFKWNFHLDPALGGIMVSLLCFNAAYLALLLGARHTYLRAREPLCAVSHVLHKVAQLLVTITPPGGTVFSQGYSVTVALLESSSFAQVVMLSYGLRMRMVWQLPVCGLLLAISFLSVSPICGTGVFDGLLSGRWCDPLLALFQALACFAAPCLMVYVLECRCRRLFAARSGAGATAQPGASATRATGSAAPAVGGGAAAIKGA